MDFLKSYRRRVRLINSIIDIARRYQHNFPDFVLPAIQDYCKHGEEGLAFDTLLTWLYEVELTPDESEKNKLIEIAEEFKIPQEDLYFWPEREDRS